MNSFRWTSKLLGVFLGLVLALAAFTPVAKASLDNQLTQLTFNTAVQVPGHKILPPGTYWFKLLDNGAAARNTMVIYNADWSQVEAVVLTRPTLRTNLSNHTELTLAEPSSANANAPMVLLRWFYPTRYTGQALVYSSHTQKRVNNAEKINVFAKTVPQRG